METLQPVVVQISGGEPLMREDLCEIVRNVKQANSLPYIILVSSWTLMTPERYLELREAGVDQFSVSLDFADSRPTHSIIPASSSTLPKWSQILPFIVPKHHPQLLHHFGQPD
jgi:MoaA/NifB/PqqE/SkfB family radical SAM enzyme